MPAGLPFGGSLRVSRKLLDELATAAAVFEFSPALVDNFAGRRMGFVLSAAH